MGHYTKLSVNLTIKPEEKNAKEIINALFHNRDYFGYAKLNRPVKGELHEFFLCDRASQILFDMNREFIRSIFFSPEEVKEHNMSDDEMDLTYGIFRDVPEKSDYTVWEPISGTLNMRSSCKNIDNEYQKFFDWIKPYLDLSKSDPYVTLEIDDPYEGILTETIFFNDKGIKVCQ